MNCDCCKKETEKLDLVFRKDQAEYLCSRCRAKPVCDNCHRRKNRLVFTQDNRRMCSVCYRRSYGL